jgi:dihydroxyacetone kinase-like predicted kinase
MGIFSKIGQFFSNLGHTIGNAVHTGYTTVTNVVSGTGKAIGKQLDEAHKTMNNVVQDVSNFASKIVDKGGEIIQHTEDKFSSIISTPLLLIAAGIGGLLLFKGDTVVAAGVQAAKY